MSHSVGCRNGLRPRDTQGTIAVHALSQRMMYLTAVERHRFSSYTPGSRYVEQYFLYIFFNPNREPILRLKNLDVKDVNGSDNRPEY